MRRRAWRYWMDQNHRVEMLDGLRLSNCSRRFGKFNSNELKYVQLMSYLVPLLMLRLGVQNVLSRELLELTLSSAPDGLL